MIISIGTEKSFNKIQHTFMIKALQKMVIEGSYPNIIKAIYDKPTANIISMVKNWNFPSEIGTRWQVCLHSPLLLSIVLEVLALAFRRKRNKRNSDWKIRSKTLTVGIKPYSEVAQLCPTLCNPMDCGPPGSSVHGIFQARILEWVAISFSRGSSQPRDQTLVFRIASRRFHVWANPIDSIRKLL